MYQDDSFFTLTLAGQTGLVLLSTLMASMTVIVFCKLARPLNQISAAGLAVIFLWLHVWLSPQPYYFYYMLLYDGLPLQSVLAIPPSPGEILRLLTFTGDFNLSAHGKGVLGWLMILIAICKRS